MKPDLMAVSCPQCGEEAALDFRQLKRNANLTLTCGKCGLVHLAFNAMRMSMYEHMKAIGRPVGEPPKPMRLEPIVIFPGEEGTEIVIRRYSNGNERTYTRRTRRPRGSAK
jgi:hypothetical protein